MRPLLAALCLAAAPLAAQDIEWSFPAQTFTSDPAHTSVLFSVNHIGFSQYTAGFDDVAATLWLDPDAPETSRLSATIRVDSLDLPTPPEGFREMLLGPDLLDATAYPEMTYVADRIIRTGEKTAKDVLATVMAIAKAIRKTAVVSGVCDGFIGNRMIEQYGRQGGFLLDEGATPQQVDKAMENFGFAMGPQGHLKVPQIGRVIVQDDVEIGANTTIDRGALKDTVIGEGTKIDNLVQIGHNVIIGRHCVIVAHTGISGSTELGDFVVMGGQSGTVGHIKIGTGAQIAGASHPKDNVPAGARYGGTPAKPLREWARELGVVAQLARRGTKEGGQ